MYISEIINRIFSNRRRNSLFAVLHEISNSFNIIQQIKRVEVNHDTQTAQISQKTEARRVNL